jgi:hypothetical protein
MIIVYRKHRVTLSNVKGFMMKRRNSMAITGLLVASLCCSSSNSLAGKHDGFIAGACAIGAALFGVAGAVALADWCCSETDAQLIARVDAQYRTAYSEYNDTIAYFGRISGMNHVSAGYKPLSSIPESVLYEFATYLWNNNCEQYTYRSNLVSAKNELKACVQSLRKRIHSLEGKCYKYEEQRMLLNMRTILHSAEEFLFNMTLFADCLDHHKTYFDLYDSIDTIRTRYLQEITLLESGSYNSSADIKCYIMSCDSGQYVFKTFVNKIERDIATLQSGVHSLAYSYNARRQYANGLINCLVMIKNIVTADPRYQQELYQWEQARLQRLHIEALEAQARAERQQAYAIYQQNMILSERNRIEQQRLYNGRHCNTAPCREVEVTVSYTR